jgi:endonuclease YncB( thermonuclease family)
MAITLLALLIQAAGEQGRAADRREWVTLTNCQYVADPDNDGDSFHFRCATNEFIGRLYFVDAPEVGLKIPEQTREQGEYFGTTLDETMKAGRAARALVEQLLQNGFTVRTRYATAQGRSKEPRIYVTVEVAAGDLGEILLSRGLARVKGVAPTLPSGEKGKDYVLKLQALEAEARNKGTNIWAGLKLPPPAVNPISN